jgi:YHS domain-containing protein
MKNAKSKAIIALVVLLSFAITIQAQDQKSKKEIAEFGGSCPVTYLMMEKDMKGDPKISSTVDGKTYYLANADAKKLFDAEPNKYLPKYDGYCATAVAMGKKVDSDHQFFTFYNGATYLFSNKMAKDTFDKDPKMMVKNADKNFTALNK